jgi:hypothetical protein
VQDNQATVQCVSFLPVLAAGLIQHCSATGDIRVLQHVINDMGQTQFSFPSLVYVDVRVFEIMFYCICLRRFSFCICLPFCFN